MRRGQYGIAKMLSIIFLVVIVFFASIVLYLFVSGNFMQCQVGKIKVEHAWLACDSTGAVAFAVNIKNIGGKPIKILEVQLAEENVTVYDFAANPIQPGATVKLSPLLAGHYLAGETYSFWVKAIFTDGSETVISATVQCLGQSTPIETVLVTFKVEGVEGDALGVILTVDGRGYSASELPVSFRWIPQTTHTFTWEEYVLSSNVTVRYKWLQTKGLSAFREGTILVVAGGQVKAKYEKIVCGVEVTFKVAGVETAFDGGCKKHLLSSSGQPLEDAIVKIIVHYGAGEDEGENVYLNELCAKNFSNIQFYASDKKTVLDYWLVNKVDGDYAEFYVRVPYIPSTPDSVAIYLCFGDGFTLTPSSEPTPEKIIQLREFDKSKNYAPKIFFKKPSPSVLRIDSSSGGSSSLGRGYVFFSYPREELNGKRLLIRWNEYYSRADSRELKLTTLYVFDALFSRTDMSSYFKPDQNREPIFDYTHIQVMYYPGPSGRSGWLGWREDLSEPLNLSSWQSEYVTVLVSLKDSWTGSRVMADIDYIQIIDESGVPLDSYDFTGEITMEVTGTYNDYGHCSEPMGTPIIHGSWSLDSVLPVVILTVDGVDYTVEDLPVSFSWIVGSTHTYVYRSWVSSTAFGQFLVLGEVVGPLSPMVVSGSTTILGRYIMQTEYLNWTLNGEYAAWKIVFSDPAGRVYGELEVIFYGIICGTQGGTSSSWPVVFSSPNGRVYGEFYSIYYSDPVESQGGVCGSWSVTVSSPNGRVYGESYSTYYSDPVGSQGGVYAVRKRD